jgi:hypothetical protein
MDGTELSNDVRTLLLDAIGRRVNQQTPGEGLRDLAQACQNLNAYAGSEVADEILSEMRYRIEHGTPLALRALSEAWALLQPPGRILDLVQMESSDAEPEPIPKP